MWIWKSTISDLNISVDLKLLSSDSSRNIHLVPMMIRTKSKAILTKTEGWYRLVYICIPILLPCTISMFTTYSPLSMASTVESLRAVWSNRKSQFERTALFITAGHVGSPRSVCVWTHTTKPHSSIVYDTPAAAAATWWKWSSEPFGSQTTAPRG